jgi:hypothetical protein
MLAQAAALLAALNPIVAHDSRESYPLTSVDHRGPVAYGHAVALAGGGAWLQYWLFYDYQDQDRGLVRTGRHEGDWELVQFRVLDGRPVEAVYAQHSGAERCGAAALTLRGGRPVVYAAHGSHASYLRPGTRDRMWPDPNDEADGRGPVVSPRLVVVSEDSPAWMRRAAPWGGSRAGWVPGEQDSPLGPVFQPGRWDAAAFAAGAGSCRVQCDAVGECDGREKTLTAAGILALLAWPVWWLRRQRTRTRTRGE